MQTAVRMVPGSGRGADSARRVVPDSTPDPDKRAGPGLRLWARQGKWAEDYTVMVLVGPEGQTVQDMPVPGRLEPDRVDMKDCEAAHLSDMDCPGFLWVFQPGMVL